MLDKDALEFANSFDIDKYGLITNLGKFQRECRFTPYYWELTMHSAHDDIDSGDTGEPDIYVFRNISDDEQNEFFPNRDKKIIEVLLWSSNDGFVTGVEIEEGEYNTVLHALRD